jgi:hypothetical protein
MTGGLLSILSYGSTDLFLTGAPQISFFKVVYRRHTNFAVESIEIGYNTNVNFDDDYELTFDRIGDLIGKTYLKIKIPEVYFSRSELSLPYVTTVEPNKDNYTIVETFMNYNMNAYRSCVNNSKLANITINKFLTDISNNFAGNGLLALNNFIDLENEQTDYNITGLMNNSNIYKLYSRYVNSTISVSDLFRYVENAMIFSKRCQKYFWKKYSDELKSYNTIIQNNLKFAWNKNIGHNIIDYIDVRLGGEQIDRHYGNYFETTYEIRKKNNLDKIHNDLIGNLEELTNYNEDVKPSYFITIPLNFWFNKNMGSAFPLVASQYSDLSLKIKFRNINQCGLVELLDNEIYTLEDFWNDKNYKLEISLLTDYIFLDGMERRKFAQSTHEYLIENVQTITENLSNYNLMNNVSNLTNQSTISDIVSYSINMDFKHPCKQLIWTLQKKIYLDDKNGTEKCIYNNYSINPREDIDPIINANILLNGYDRINKKLGTAKYFNLIQSYQHNTNIGNCGIYSYSFAIFPEDLQPSSSCNFSRFLSQTLQIDLNGNLFYYALSDINPKIDYNSVNDVLFNYTDVIINIYAIVYNVIRINGGFSALAFSFTQLVN